MAGQAAALGLVTGLSEQSRRRSESLAASSSLKVEALPSSCVLAINPEHSPISRHQSCHELLRPDQAKGVGFVAEDQLVYGTQIVTVHLVWKWTMAGHFDLGQIGPVHGEAVLA